MAKLIDIEKIKPMDFPSTEMDGLDVVRYLNTLPTADAVEVAHGRWICHEIEYAVRWRECSVCKYEIHNVNYNYCPNCGAKMDGVYDG